MLVVVSLQRRNWRKRRTSRNLLKSLTTSCTRLRPKGRWIVASWRQPRKLNNRPSWTALLKCRRISMCKPSWRLAINGGVFMGVWVEGEELEWGGGVCIPCIVCNLGHKIMDVWSKNNSFILLSLLLFQDAARRVRIYDGSPIMAHPSFLLRKSAWSTSRCW